MSRQSLIQKRRRIQLEINSEDLFEERSPIKSSNASKPKKKPRIDDNFYDDTLFVELLSKCEYTLKKGSQPNLLGCDQAVFQKALRKSISLHTQFSKEVVVSKFIEGLEDYLKDEVHLKSSLLYTQTAQDCDSGRRAQQDSLIRLLLNIDDFQPKLVTLLSEKLFEVAYNEGDSKAEIPCLILANLRWLDHVVDSKLMTDKIVDLLEGCPTEIQKEVINFVPNIVDDEYHHRVAAVLCDLFQSTPELTAVILDTLTCLTLPSENLLEIRQTVLKTLPAVQPHNLPIVIKFLLHQTSSNSLHEVVSEIREKISLPGERREVLDSSQIKSSRRTPKKKVSETECDNLEVLTFSNIKIATLLHKSSAAAWLKAVDDVKEVTSILPFDFLILIVFYQEIPSKKKAIETIFRNLIRLGVAPDTYLKSTFEKHKALLKEYFESVKKIAAQLIRSPEVAIVHFGSAIYRYCFICLESYQKHGVILALLSHLGDNENVRQGALNILSQLAHQCTDTMAKYILYLKGALDVVDIFNLRDAKTLMDTIIHLAHHSENEASVKEEISILIRKQLSQTNAKYKRLGILSAVLTLKNSVGPDTQCDEDSENSELEGPLKEAEVLFHTVMECTLHSPTCSALFMDELATNILKNGLNSKLERLIRKEMNSDFEKIFVVEYSSSTDIVFPFDVSYQWNLDVNADSEENVPIAVALAQLVIKDYNSQNSNTGNNVIVTLAPHFRLMRMVESHLEGGDLRNIDALLGCGIELPVPAVYDKFSSLSDKEQTLSLNCLFYTVNWLRELVNAFATQKDSELKERVILRFRKLITLQELLSKLLPLRPTYVPPPAVFDTDVTTSFNAPSSSGAKKEKPNKPLKKKQKKNKMEESQSRLTGVTQQAGNCTQSQKPSASSVQTNESVADLSNYRGFLRELHLDVFNLLFRNLCFDSNSDEKNVKFLLMSEAEFLLSDMNQKFSRIFEVETKRLSALSKSKAGDVGFSHLNVFNASEVSSLTHIYIKPICIHMEKIFHYFEDLITENDGVEDSSSMFTDWTIRVTNVFTALLTSLRLLLSWQALQMEENDNLLMKILKLIAKNLERDSVNKMTKEELVQVCYRYLGNFEAAVVNISTSVALIRLLDSVISFSSDNLLKIKLVTLIEKFLKKEWYTYGGNEDKGLTFNRKLDELLRIYFRYCSDPITVVHSISSSALKEVSQSKAKNSSSDTYCTLRKSSQNVYYNALFENLVSGTNKMLSSTSCKANAHRQLQVWNLSINSLNLLLDPLKSLKHSPMFATCLRYTKGFFELFLRKGMPLMDKCLQTYQKEVIALLKNLQLNTRFLQHLCTHVKRNRYANLVTYVPVLKKLLETLVFRVKAMMTLNGCQDAFWLGNLKNRDLQGEELLSQSEADEDQETEAENEEEEEAEDEEEALDAASDVDLDDDETDDAKEKRRESYSVSY